MNEPNKKTSQIPESYSPKKPEILNMTEETNTPASVERLQAYIQNNGEPPKRSKKIANIRRLWHDDKSENFYLEGCLTAVMKAIGENPKYDYPFFLALCGDFFTQPYSDTKNAGAGITDAFDAVRVKYILDMCGYDCIYIDNDTIKNKYNLIVDVIKTAIDQNIPIITKGIGNAQCGDRYYNHFPFWSIIGGYDENDILYVNVFPQETVTDEHGYAKIKNGLVKSDGLYIIGNKIRKPEYSDILLKAIHAIPIFISMPDMGGYSFGQKAYYDWSDMLMDESVDAATAQNRYFGAAVANCTMWYYFREHFDRIIEDLNGYDLAVKVKEFYYKLYSLSGPEMKEYFASKEEMADPEFRKALAKWAHTAGDLHNELLELFKEKKS